MEIYRSNRNCGCIRCRCRGIMGGVVLMTLGFMFLLDEFHVRDLDFDRTMPLLLIAIGVVLLLQRTASTDGHVQPYVQPYAMPPAASMPGVGPQTGSTTDASSAAPTSEVRHE
jgi:hypothetical protein